MTVFKGLASPAGKSGMSRFHPLRAGESIEPGNLAFVIVATGLVSVGPSSKALCKAFCQRNIHWECPFGLIGSVVLSYRKRV